MTARTHFLRNAYRQEIGILGYQPDHAQLESLDRLQRILDDLSSQKTTEPGLLSRMGWFRKRKVPPVRGAYLWGGVGRGKTFLMDLFFRAVPGERKQRVHFHRFMLSIHKQLHARKSETDPLDRIAADIASRISVLCFDELFVADITDAMVLARLFHVLVDSGVTLVFTSNTEPSNLYRDGLQRERFLPAIELIKTHCDVFSMDGGTDYRLRTLRSADTYLCPHDETTNRKLSDTFDRLAGDEPVEEGALSVLGRDIPVRKVSEGVCWFDFHHLCEGPRSKADYAELSRFFHTLLISDIPLLGIDGEDPARRFVELIDELYDRRVNVLVSAADAPESLYRGNRLKHGFQRTASRLREFSSPDYMASGHRP